MRIGILEPKDFSPNAFAVLKTFGEVAIYDGGDIIAFLKPLDALFTRLAFNIDKRFLQNAPNLRWLCAPTTGHTHIDENALAEHGVRLLSLRGEREFLDTIRATPEHTLGLVIALLRRYRRAFDAVSSGKWDRDICKGEEIYGNSVGIIGLGRVGFRLALYFDALGANVGYFDVAEKISRPSWQRFSSISELIDRNRIIVLCASHKNSATHIIGWKEVCAMEDRYFINTARGELVDEVSLLKAVRDKKLLGLAMDVICNENGENNLDEWIKLIPDNNLIITPHIAGATFTSMARTECFIAHRLHTEVSTQGR